MEFINKLIDKIVSNHLTEPIVYKHESELQLKYDALMKSMKIKHWSKNC